MSNHDSGERIELPEPLRSPKSTKPMCPFPISPAVSRRTNTSHNVYFPNNLFIAQTLERVDENIGERVRLFGRFHWQDLTYANGNQVPVTGGYGPANSRNYAFGYTHVITPNLVNDFHIGVNQFLTDSLNYWYVNGLTSAGTDLGIPGFNFDTTDNMPGIPNVQLSYRHRHEYRKQRHELVPGRSFHRRL